MADGSNRKENCFSVELKLLEAEYERSKLQVFQDTFFCKRSIVELELLCKNEQLMKNVRVNNKLREHECRLKVKVKDNGKRCSRTFIYQNLVIWSSLIAEFRIYGHLIGSHLNLLSCIGAGWIPVNGTWKRHKSATNHSKDTPGKCRLPIPVFSSLLGIGEIDRGIVV